MQTDFQFNLHSLYFPKYHIEAFERLSRPQQLVQYLYLLWKTNSFFYKMNEFTCWLKSSYRFVLWNYYMNFHWYFELMLAWLVRTQLTLSYVSVTHHCYSFCNLFGKSRKSIFIKKNNLFNSVCIFIEFSYLVWVQPPPYKYFRLF